MRPLILLVPLLLAGCTAAPADAPASPTRTADALTSASTAEAAAPAPAPEGARATPFSYEGNTGWGFGLWTPVSMTFRHGAENRFHEIVPEGVPLVLAGEVSWTSRTPTALAVALVVKDGDAYTYAERERHEYGASPLRFEWDVSDLAGQVLAIRVAPGRVVSVNDLGASVSASQAFAVEGTLVWQPPPGSA